MDGHNQQQYESRLRLGKNSFPALLIVLLVFNLTKEERAVKLLHFCVLGLIETH